MDSFAVHVVHMNVTFHRLKLAPLGAQILEGGLGGDFLYEFFNKLIYLKINRLSNFIDFFV